MAVVSYYPTNVPVFMGLSTDAKPNAPPGSKFIETDTGNVWLYLNTGVWSEVLAGTTNKVTTTTAGITI